MSPIQDLLSLEGEKPYGTKTYSKKLQATGTKKKKERENGIEGKWNRGIAFVTYMRTCIICQNVWKLLSRRTREIRRDRGPTPYPPTPFANAICHTSAERERDIYREIAWDRWQEKQKNLRQNMLSRCEKASNNYNDCIMSKDVYNEWI